MAGKPNRRDVTPRPDGKWASEKPGAERASSVHDTQKEAAAAGKRQLENAGGGELRIKGRDGRVREQNTISPGNDPRRSRG